MKIIGNNNNLKDDLIRRSIKIVDIVYISIIYIFLAFYISLFLDKYVYPVFFKNDEKTIKAKTHARIIFECGIIAGLLGIIIYIMRNLVVLLPFPLEGISGYTHLKTNEVRNSTLFTACMILFSLPLQQRYKIITSRFFPNI